MEDHSIFSSPEHKVLKVSYCDRSLSVVRSAFGFRRQLFPSNDISSLTTWPILIKLHRDDPWMVPFHYCSKKWIPCRTLVSMATERKNLKNLLDKNHSAESLDIWCVALPNGPLPRLLKLCPWGQNWPRPGSHLFYIEIYTVYREIFENLLVRNR